MEKVSRYVYNATIALLRDDESDTKPSWMDIKRYSPVYCLTGQKTRRFR